jgi:hypothetical protein
MSTLKERNAERLKKSIAGEKADGHAVHHEAGGQDHAHQAGEDGDEGAQQARIHKTHEAVRQVQHQHQGQVQAGHPAGADLGGAQQLLHLLLQLLSLPTPAQLLSAALWAEKCVLTNTAIFP